MTKKLMSMQDKVTYVNKIADKFINARNHGNNGSSWWHPNQFCIAYNVKLKNFYYVGDIREQMTAKQNEFYSDETLSDFVNQTQNDQCEMAIEDIKMTFDIADVHFAGRSGGWLEVTYHNEGLDFVDKDTTEDVLNDMYWIAENLDKREKEVEEFIVKGLKGLNKYIGSKQSYTDIIENYMMTDDEIDQLYKDQIKSLKAKLKN